MNEPGICTYCNQNGIEYFENVLISSKSCIKRGGLARFWIEPTDYIKLKSIVSYLQLHSIAFEVVGSLTNLYFLNSYNPDVVLCTAKANAFTFDNGFLVTEPGAKMVSIAREGIKLGITGLESFVGLPGTIGGAVVNNSGCYGQQIDAWFYDCEVARNGQILTLTKNDLAYQHRSSALKGHPDAGVILKIRLILNVPRSESAFLEDRAIKFNQHRSIVRECARPNLGATFSTFNVKKVSFIKFIPYLIIKFIIKLLYGRSKSYGKVFTLFNKFFLGNNSFNAYISDKGYNVFVWTDEKADQEFQKYVQFVKKVSPSSKLEIEVRG